MEQNPKNVEVLQEPVGTAFHRRPRQRSAVERRPYRNHAIPQLSHVYLLVAMAAVALCGGCICGNDCGRSGSRADSPKAPTILSILGYEVPDAMRGRNALR